MNFRLYTPVFLESDFDVILPGAENANSYPVYVACDDSIVAGAIYNYITSNCDLSKNFTSEDFNDALEDALNQPEHRVKKCNLALAVYSHAGCFVAQMGKSRVFQVRPETREIEYDSRAQVLDIYSSKAKVELIKDIKPNDYLFLCSAEDVDEKAVRKILCNDQKDDQAKLAEIAQVIKSLKTSGGNRPGAVLSHVEYVQGGGSGLSFMSGFKVKYLLYALVFAGVAALGAWLVMTNPFAGMGSDDNNSINPDSLVTTKAPNRADTTYVKPPVDSLAMAAELDSLKKMQVTKNSIKMIEKKKAEALKKAKAQAEAAKVNEEDIKEVHSTPAATAAPAEHATPQVKAEEPAVKNE